MGIYMANPYPKANNTLTLLMASLTKVHLSNSSMTLALGSLGSISGSKSSLNGVTGTLSNALEKMPKSELVECAKFRLASDKYDWFLLPAKEARLIPELFLRSLELGLVASLEVLELWGVCGKA